MSGNTNVWLTSSDSSQDVQQSAEGTAQYGHLGAVKMESLARACVWWPEIDKQNEDLSKHCSGCQKVQNAPPQGSTY